MLRSVEKDERIKRVKRAKQALDRAREGYVAELKAAHDEDGIGWRTLAAALGTDPASVMRFLKRNT